jgi:hypothetical protein
LTHARERGADYRGFVKPEPANNSEQDWLRARLLAASTLVLILAACGGGGSSTSLADLQPQSARATRPAACSYAHVWVTVSSVRVLRDDSGTQHWQDIALASPQRIDLLATSGGVLQALGAAPLQAGHYTQLRLLLADTGNSVQPTGGAEAALNVPSGTSSGLKLVGDITVASGAAADVVLDGFDPCAAIVVTGNGAYSLQPEAEVRMQPVAQAGAEVPGPFGWVIPVPGGGWAVASQAGANFPWTLQRFDASGSPVSTASGLSTGVNIATSFAALTGGGYAAVWLDYAPAPGSYNVMTRTWDAAGNPLSAPTAVALVMVGKLGHPAALPQIAALTAGGYVIVWGLPPTDDGIYAQRFTASGTAAAPAVRATDSGTGSLGVTGLTSGGYLVTWGRFGSSSGGVQAFSAADAPVGPVQSAGSNGDGAGPPIPAVRALAGGGAVMAWQAAGEHLMMQQVAADGTPVTPAQIVDDQTASPTYSYIAIGALPDGGSVIAWVEGSNTYARRYLASGAPAGPQTQVNLVTTSMGAIVGVAVHADGTFEIHWVGTRPDATSPTMYVRTFPSGALVG